MIIHTYYRQVSRTQVVRADEHDLNAFKAYGVPLTGNDGNVTYDTYPSLREAMARRDELCKENQ